MLDKLYDMAIGERRREDIIDMSIVRVPGGWIFIDYNGSSSQSQCFVPYVDKEAAQIKGSVQNSTGEYTPTNKAMVQCSRWSKEHNFCPLSNQFKCGEVACTPLRTAP